MRLIDADEAIINFGFEWDDISPTRDEFVEFIKKQPTIEAEPVKHGTWKLVEFQSPSFGIDHVLMCTNCGFVHEYDAWFNRCPNCTARMDRAGAADDGGECIMSNIVAELYHDNFQNYKRYNIPKAQLVIADIPYNIGVDAYASNPMWYEGGNNKNGESRLAKKAFFNTDGKFRIPEYMHFCSKMLIKEPKEKGSAPAMIVFCAFEQMQTVIECGKQYGFVKSYPLFFCKNYSAQVLKANMKIVGATEFAVVLYRDKLPKFRNTGEDGKGHMVFDWFPWERDNRKEYPKIHPTQKPIAVLKRLIEIFTDPGDVVIDPCAGSGSTLRAAAEIGRRAYGFEVDKAIYQRAKEEMLSGLESLEQQIAMQEVCGVWE